MSGPPPIAVTMAKTGPNEIKVYAVDRSNPNCPVVAQIELTIIDGNILPMALNAMCGFMMQQLAGPKTIVQAPGEALDQLAAIMPLRGNNGAGGGRR